MMTRVICSFPGCDSLIQPRKTYCMKCRLELSKEIDGMSVATLNKCIANYMGYSVKYQTESSIIATLYGDNRTIHISSYTRSYNQLFKVISEIIQDQDIMANDFKFNKRSKYWTYSFVGKRKNSLQTIYSGTAETLLQAAVIAITKSILTLKGESK